MFSAEDYIGRRQCLQADVGSGLILFIGNGESPINTPDNYHFFRQDSSFLYFWGLDIPHLAAVIDVDRGIETIFGNDPSLEELIWIGPREQLSEQCRKVGVVRQLPLESLTGTLGDAIDKRRPIHYLPPYRMDQTLQLAELLHINKATVSANASMVLIRSVVRQRSAKSEAEVAEIEAAVAVNHAMQTAAMRMSVPGRYEREVVGAIEGIAYGRSGRRPPFATIFSMHGQILHNHGHTNQLQAGDLAICDCGAESPRGYASDITRTIPVGGRFTSRQKEIYDIVLHMQADALDAMRPGVPFKDVHLVAARRLVEDFKAIGLMRGDVDQMVENGAFALFFPHGLGHMLGLDVHDMESLGEDHVGYSETIRRDHRFGLDRLRLAKPLMEGFVVTVEPGIYFIPQLIDQWRQERRFSDQINYRKIDDYLGLGGVRIEDDVLISDTAAAVLGPPIPKTVAEVEDCCGR